jgi:hypothetical protein
MVDGSEGHLRSNLMAEILEHVVVGLLGIVNGDFSWDTIAAEDVLPEKFLDGCGAYARDKRCLNLFCEILNYYNGKGVVALSWS